MNLKSAIVGVVAAGVFACASYAQAQQQWMGGTSPQGQQKSEWMGGKMDFYLGAAMGYAKADIGVGLPAGFWFDSSTTDDTNLGWKLYAGFPFYPGLAVELGYTRLGRFGFNGSAQPGATLSTTYRVLGYTADLVATLPLAYKLSLMARIGGYYNETSPTTTATGALVASPNSGSDRDWNLRTGLGLQYDIARDWAIRAEAEQFRKLGPNNLNVDLYSIGVVYRIE